MMDSHSSENVLASVKWEKLKENEPEKGGKMNQFVSATR